jgi:hypothetical protein
MISSFHAQSCLSERTTCGEQKYREAHHNCQAVHHLMEKMIHTRLLLPFRRFGGSSFVAFRSANFTDAGGAGYFRGGLSEKINRAHKNRERGTAQASPGQASKPKLREREREKKKKTPTFGLRLQAWLGNGVINLEAKDYALSEPNASHHILCT